MALTARAELLFSEYRADIGRQMPDTTQTLEHLNGRKMRFIFSAHLIVLANTSARRDGKSVPVSHQKQTEMSTIILQPL